MNETIEVPHGEYRRLVERDVVLEIICRVLSAEKYVTLNDVRRIVGLEVKKDGTAGEPDAD